MKIILLFFFSIPLFLHSQHTIIPEPASFSSYQGEFALGNEVVVAVDRKDALQDIMSLFTDQLAMLGVKPIYSVMNSNDPHIAIELLSASDPELGDEGYELKVSDHKVSLMANQPAGVFNGLQSLLQLIPLERGNSAYYSIPGCTIRDYPRFAWRGMMLDVSRHFFSVEDVKKFIDQMSVYKFNVLHWHLTDDEGWRIEIKSLPKLTEVGAWRVERHGRFGENRPYPKPGEKATYGGFYSQEEIIDIVDYAAQRNITIVPEIDVPGHSMAALAAYPELSVKKEPKFVNPGSKFAEWYGGGKFKMLIENTLNPADEAVYEFLDKVFTEVAMLFPGKYIHMGGDECYKGYWEEDPEVQKFMKENNIHDSHELQSYFVTRVEKIISSKGKKLIGWDEILEGGLAEGAAVMSWRGMSGGIEAARQGHQVVMSPTTFCYLDYTQGDHSVENRIYADLSLGKTYQFEPIPEDVDPQYILGGQGNLWSEVIPHMDYAFYMTYPRAFAIAETLWSPREKKDWNNFMAKVEHHFERFQMAGNSISTAVHDPIVGVSKNGNDLILELSTETPGAEIFFTLDNTFPVHFGQKYQKPVMVPEGDLSLKVQCYRNGQPIGRMLSLHRTTLEERAR